MFGQIYEYFLGNFAMSEGQGGGEFFTPRSVVRLMVEIIEPHGGKVFDPACGSGGMFVQSAQFIEQHRQDAAADLDVYVYGTEKTLETVKLAKMNLAPRASLGRIVPFESAESTDAWDADANVRADIGDVGHRDVEAQGDFLTTGGVEVLLGRRRQGSREDRSPKRLRRMGLQAQLLQVLLDRGRHTNTSCHSRRWGRLSIEDPTPLRKYPRPVQQLCIWGLRADGDLNPPRKIATLVLLQTFEGTDHVGFNVAIPNGEVGSNAHAVHGREAERQMRLTMHALQVHPVGSRADAAVREVESAASIDVLERDFAFDVLPFSSG